MIDGGWNLPRSVKKDFFVGVAAIFLVETGLVRIVRAIIAIVEVEHKRSIFAFVGLSNDSGSFYNQITQRRIECEVADISFALLGVLEKVEPLI